MAIFEFTPRSEIAGVFILGDGRSKFLHVTREERAH